MSCDDCEEDASSTYYRVGKANIGLVGCEDHLGEAIKKLRQGDAIEDWIEEKEQEVEEAQEKYNALDKLNKVSADAKKALLVELKEEVLEE